jgi:ArsR family transcriptional regulator
MRTHGSGVETLSFYKALAEQTRLLSLLLIDAEGELCVCELMAALELPQPHVSRHLAQLRKSGVLADRRQGQWVYYRLHPQLPDWMREVLSLTRENSASLLQAPLARLRGMADRPPAGGACCSEATSDRDIGQPPA